MVLLIVESVYSTISNPCSAGGSGSCKLRSSSRDLDLLGLSKNRSQQLQVELDGPRAEGGGIEIYISGKVNRHTHPACRCAKDCVGVRFFRILVGLSG